MLAGQIVQVFAIHLCGAGRLTQVALVAGQEPGHVVPFELALDWEEFASAARAGGPASADKLIAEIAALIEGADKKTKERAEAALKRAGNDSSKLAQLADWLKTKRESEAA